MLIAQLNQRLNLQRFFKGEGPQATPLQLHQRNVYILPTRQGLFFTVVLFVMLIGSINYTNSLGYLLTFLLGSLTVVAILHTYRNLLRLQISLGHINPVFQGQQLQIPVVISNPQATARYALEFSFPHQSPHIYDLSPALQQTITLTKLAPARGAHQLERFVIASRFPLGLFRAWAHIEIDQRYLVYPQPVCEQPLPDQSLYVHQETGDQGHGADDFAGLRNFRAGDSLRHVHWKALARDRGLLTKQFGGDRNDQLWLDWRMLENMLTEQRLSCLCRWVLDAEEQGYDYGLWLPGQSITPARGDAHQYHCLKTLALYNDHHAGQTSH